MMIFITVLGVIAFMLLVIVIRFVRVNDNLPAIIESEEKRDDS